MRVEGTVTSKGQLVIPAELRSELKIAQGTRVRFERIKGGIAIYPNYSETIRKACGRLAGLGLPPDLPREAMDREIK